MFRPGEGTGGGMMTSPPGVPTAWTAYIGVADAAEATGAVFGMWANKSG
jgi:predicted enzyme related to lactoylglutathione lyase